MQPIAKHASLPDLLLRVPPAAGDHNTARGNALPARHTTFIARGAGGCCAEQRFQLIAIDARFRAVGILRAHFIEVTDLREEVA